MEELKYRIYAVLAVMCASGLVLVGQLVRWQIIQHNAFVEIATAEHRDELVIAPRRGEMRDQSGYLLATDVMQYNISASPKIISDPYSTADRLANLLNLSRDELLNKLTSKDLWVPIANNVSQPIGETIMKWDIVGLKADVRTKRMYPEGNVASHLLGFVNENGYGFYGLEGYYDGMLRGKPGLQKGERSPFGEVIPWGISNFIPPSSGTTLHVTIRRNVQYLIEAELQKAVQTYQAKRGSVIVLEPKTGAVLGIASYPNYDPNNYGTSDENLFVDPSVSDQYEPGSVFKIVTMAAGLDANVIVPETTVYDGGSIEVGGRVIYDWDRKAHGTVDMTTIMAQSLNVGIAQIAVALGKDRFYTYIKRFGFGRLTEIDLSGEGPGTLKTPKDATWHESDIGANSFGQGIAVTPMQMANSVAAVANDGLLMKPHLVKRIVDSDREVEVKPMIVRRAVSEKTAHTLTDLLVTALEQSDSAALVPGYRVAGKTGTAEIPIPGGYHPTLTVASFVGYLPADNPQVLVLVIIDRPTVSRWGNDTAAPTFARIAKQLVILLDIPPDSVQVTMK